MYTHVQLKSVNVVLLFFWHILHSTFLPLKFGIAVVFRKKQKRCSSERVDHPLCDVNHLSRVSTSGDARRERDINCDAAEDSNCS